MKKLFLLLFLTGCQTNLSGNIANSTSSTGTSGTSETPIVLPNIRLGDRYYVSSVFSTIFQPTQAEGATAGEVSTIQYFIDTNIGRQFTDFGGACDYFSNSTEYCGSGAVNIGSAIVETTNVMASPLAQATSLRSAMSLRTIYGLIAYDPALRKAISLAKSTTYGAVNLTGIAGPTLTELQTAYSIVYPGVIPSLATLNKIHALTSSVESSYNGKEAWKMAYNVLLSTLLWQQL